MPKIFNRFMNMIGGIEEDYEDEDEIESEKDQEEEEIKRLPTAQTKRGNKIVNMYENNYTKVSIIRLEKYDDAVLVCDDLKSRKIVVFNTSLLESKEAQRSIDSICGAAYVLEADFS
ncbi:MAG: cell division protein SepF, partial [Oscillospiraceae bacterium]|nr:cell division protein SepF [Oscillospiraceae bacterium]